MTDKKALRARLRANRDEFAANAGIVPAPAPFVERLRLRVRLGAIVATYQPVGGEADPSEFDLAVLAAAGELALPVVIDRASPLRFLRWPRHGALVRGPFGLWQPPAEAPEVKPDIIVTPLVGFDRRGNRLGQGAGHYDRAFAEYPNAWRVGVAWSVQEVDALVPDPWDVPLHAVATEKEWITP